MNTRRTVVEIHGKEVLTYFAQVVIGVPSDVSDDEIKQLSGEDIKRLVAEVNGEIEWHLDDSDGIVADDTIHIVDIVDLSASPELVFFRDVTGKLLCATTAKLRTWRRRFTFFWSGYWPVSQSPLIPRS